MSVTHTNMSVTTLLCLVLLQDSAVAVNTRLSEVFSWSTLQIRDNGTELQLGPDQFVPANNMPARIEIWAERVFLSVPRYKPGVIASLLSFKLNSTTSNTTESPEMSPYPNLEMNNHTDLKAWPPHLLSVISMRADPCDRLWVLDTGLVESVLIAPPKLVIFDLKTDRFLFTYPLKEKANFNEKSFFPSLTVDVTSANCDSAFVYIPDANNYNLIVYSLFSNDTHVITHNYFHFDPLSEWNSQRGIYGLALSPVNREGFRTVFFHALSSTMEFAVNSKYLQNTSMVSALDRKAFKVVGNRGTGGQCSSAVLDEETGVIFYTLLKRHAVGCWNSFKGDEYEGRSLGQVADNMMMSSFPVDLRVDKKGELWVLASPLLRLLGDATLNTSVTNVWVFKAPVRQAIKSTVCDEM